MAWHGMAWQGKARQGKARQGKARQGKARQGKARQGKARQGKARQGDVPDIVQVCVHKRNQARVVLPLAIEDLVHRHFLAGVQSSGSRLCIVCVNAKIYMAEKVGVFMMMPMRGVLGVMV
jgi:hypothetical protein